MQLDVSWLVSDVLFNVTQIRFASMWCDEGKKNVHKMFKWGSFHYCYRGGGIPLCWCLIVNGDLIVL